MRTGLPWEANATTVQGCRGIGGGMGHGGQANNRVPLRDRVRATLRVLLLSDAVAAVGCQANFVRVETTADPADQK